MVNRHLEILSRYLPYGLDIQIGLTSEKLTGIDLSGNNPKAHFGYSSAIALEDAKPILYSFEDLTRPILEDGKIPAIEIAKLAWPEREWGDEQGTENLVWVDSGFKDQVLIHSDFNIQVMRFVEELDWEEVTPQNQALIQQKLLEWGFAVGLEEYEYIKKEVQP